MHEFKTNIFKPPVLKGHWTRKKKHFLPELPPKKNNNNNNKKDAIFVAFGSIKIYKTPCLEQPHNAVAIEYPLGIFTATPTYSCHNGTLLCETWT